MFRKRMFKKSIRGESISTNEIKISSTPGGEYWSADKEIQHHLEWDYRLGDVHDVRPETIFELEVYDNDNDLYVTIISISVVFSMSIFDVTIEPSCLGLLHLEKPSGEFIISLGEYEYINGVYLAPYIEIIGVG